MARYRVTVRTLLQEAKVDADTGLLLLMEAGFEFDSIERVVPKSTVARARAALNLPRRPEGACLQVTELATRSGKLESEVRTVLRRAGLLRKFRQKYVPYKSLGSALDM